MLALLAAAIGIGLGLHFTVLILVPGSFLMALIFVGLYWLASTPVAGFSSLLLTLCALQSGYMLGLSGRNAYGHLLVRLNIIHSRRV